MRFLFVSIPYLTIGSFYHDGEVRERYFTSDEFAHTQ